MFNASGIAPCGLDYPTLAQLWTTLGGSALPPSPFPTPGPVPVPPGPTPTPTPPSPPSPTPPGPSPTDLKDAIDLLFAAIEKRTRRAMIVLALEMTRHMIDSYLDSLPQHKLAALRASTLQQIVDSVFAAIIAGVRNPIVVFMLVTAQGIVDQYLSSMES